MSGEGGASSPCDFDALIREGIPVLRQVAERLARRLGGVVPVDELVSMGHPALLDAARVFDPSRSSFSAYAARRVGWAMLDAVRRETHGRAARGRALALSASERFGAAFPALDDDPPLEPRSEADYQRRLRELLSGHAAAFALGLGAGAAPLGSIAHPGATPEELAARGELYELLHAAVSRLPPRQRELVERHYFGGEPFDAVAARLGISKSWASRLHAAAIRALGRAINDGT